ncbi:hypothetical protein [Arcobacter sp.]|uniref:hypothetical protein n=1 Tax=Arcobacter sp. TaxID=1872629 RepID=UPI003C72FF7C
MKKYILVVIFVLTSLNANNCEALYKDILVGNSESLKKYIKVKCGDFKKETDYKTYKQEFIKKEISAKSLVCMGDSFLNRSINQASFYYYLASQLDNKNAKQSLGLIYKNHDLDKLKEIIPQKQLEEYSKDSYDNFNFYNYLLEKQISNHNHEKYKEPTQHLANYINQCIYSINEDYKKQHISLVTMKYTREFGLDSSKEYEEWINLQGMIVESLARNLEKIKKRFVRFARSESIKIEINNNINKDELDSKIIGDLYSQKEREREEKIFNNKASK